MHSGSFFITIEIPAQVFSYEFGELLGTHFFTENLHETEKES